MSRKPRRGKGKAPRTNGGSTPASVEDIKSVIAQADYQRATRLLRLQISRHPTDECRRLLAECLVNMQAYCEAQDALEHIHEKSALDVGLIGWACLHQGMWGSA
ncbi:MAG TPA: hypothetical protein VFU63_09295, partial [Ktedonobacterales bacterium]|nr:hypothetical protein [Ktedonobacterales bacterium]